MKWLTQVWSITHFNLQTIPQRWGGAAAAVFGIAGVVTVLVGVLSIAAGFRHAMMASGADDAAIVLRSGSTGEIVSILQGDEARVIAEAAGIARTAQGGLVSPELFVLIDLPKRSTGTVANVPLRGVGEMAVAVRDKFEIVEGRMFGWGRNEVIVGSGAAIEFAGLEVGGALEVAGERWPIVGRFEEGDGIAESEIWTDARLLQSSYRRGDSYQSVYAKLSSPDGFMQFKDELTTDPRVNVAVNRLIDYYSQQSTLVTSMITGIGGLVAALMGIGAVIGALNTMYTAVSSRTREIGTLRALGFKSGPVVVSVLIESLLLALIGGAIGGVLAWVVFDGFRAATINWQSFSQVAFAFAVTPSLLIQGVSYATLIGFIGGLFPAIRAARMPVADALRST